MRHRDRQLSKRPPEWTLGLRRTLPGGLQQLVRLKRTSRVEQLLRSTENRFRTGGFEGSQLRVRGDALGAVRERTS